jgi:hypothetical protein
MEVLLKSIYCLLFGAVAYLLRQILISNLLPDKKEVIALLAVVASILLVTHFTRVPNVLPTKSIYTLLQFDIMLVVMFIMQGFAMRRARSRLNKQITAHTFFEGFFGIAEQLRGTVIFIMIYIFQIVAICSPIDFM